MLRNLDTLRGFKLDASDGEIGKVDDFFFDDRQWVVRYIVVDTGDWLPGRLVLISPESVGAPDWDNKRLPVSLTTDQIEQSPGVEADKPISRQMEKQIVGYYGWPIYWSPISAQGVAGLPASSVAPPATPKPGQPGEGAEAQAQGAEPQAGLRSANEVEGYHIQAVDDEVGHVEDFVADTQSWPIRYLVVDTRNILPGKKVLVSPAWLTSVDWSSQKVMVDLTTDAIKSGPQVDLDKPIDRQVEQKLHEHFGKKAYWQES